MVQYVDCSGEGKDILLRLRNFLQKSSYHCSIMGLYHIFPYVCLPPCFFPSSTLPVPPILCVAQLGRVRGARADDEGRAPPLIMTPCDGDPLARLPSRCSRPMDQLQACARLRVLVCVTLAVKSGTRRSHSISAGRADGRSDSWAWTDPGPNPLPAPSSIHRAPLPPSCPSTRQMPCRDGMGGRKRGHHDAR